MAADEVWLPFQKQAPQAPVGATSDWALAGRPGNRSLSHNGGYISTPAYLLARGGIPTLRRGQPSGLEAVEAAAVPSKEALAGFGKTSIKIAPQVPIIYDPDAEMPERAPGSEYGFVQQTARAITDFATGFLPEDLQQHAENLAGLIGGAADLPLEAFTHAPLPWQPGVEEAFARIPESPQKSDALIRMEGMDSTEQHWFMSQYIRSHQGELAQALGVPTIFAPFFMPDATLLERTFAAIGIPQKMLEQTILRITNPDQGYIEHAAGDLSKMPQMQRVTYEKYNRGEFGTPGSPDAIGRLRDELTIAGFGYTDDPFVNMMLGFLDPVIVGGMGTGLAKLARGGALLRQAGDIIRVTRYSANPVVRAAYEAASLAERTAAAVPRPRLRRALGEGETIEAKIANRLRNDPRPEVQDAIQQARREYVDATKTSRGRLRAQADLMLTSPMGSRIINGAARVSDVLNSPFGIFGRDGIAGAIGKSFRIKGTQGFLAGYELGKVYGIVSKVPERFREELEQNLGHAVAYAERSVHQSTLTKILRVTGRKERADFMPDNITPDQVSKSMRDIDNPYAAMQMEYHIRDVKTQYGPEPGMDPKVYWKQERERAAVKLSKSTGMSLDEARAITRNFDADELGFVDNLYFGKLIRQVIEAKKADLAIARQVLSGAEGAARGAAKRQLKAAEKAFKEAEATVSNIARYTVVGPRELTLAKAQKLRAAIESADIDGAFATAEGAVAQFDLLRVNFWTKQVDADKALFLKNMKAFLDDVIEKGSLVVTVGLDNLPENMKALMEEVQRDLGDVGYEIGLAPQAAKLWRVVYDEEGRAIGYVGWMDIDTEAQAMRAPTRLDVIRNAVIGATRGETMAQEARRKFVRDAHAYGISTQDARTLWSALRREAITNEVTIRGLNPGAFKKIVEEADIPNELRKRLGYRELQVMAVRALEADIRHSGITSKATSRMKSATANVGSRGNYIGFIAENVYPNVRFHYNPMFWIQEWIEPLYLNILRGKKPRFSFNEENVKQMNDILDHFDLGTGLSDGVELRHSWTLGAYHTHLNMGPSTGLAGLTERISRKVTGIASIKATNAEALTRDLLGQYFREAMERIAPGQHAEIRAVMNQLDRNKGGKGHLSDGELAVRYLAQQGFYDPDLPHAHIQLYDGAKPKDLGRIEGIRKAYLARALRGPDGETFASGADLKRAIEAGELDEWDARSQMAVMGYDPDYISRAWAVARGVDVDDFLDGIERDYASFLPPAEARQARDLMHSLLEMNAVRKGMDTEEYVATKFADLGKHLDSAGRLPYNAYTQLTDRLMEEAGLKVFKDGAPEVENLRARAKTMLPDTPHEKVSEHTRQLRLTREATEKGKVRAEPTKGRLKGRIKQGRFVAYGDVDTERWKEMTIAAMDEENITGAGQWYRSMVGRFASIADRMDEVTLRELATEMNRLMPSLHPIDLADDLPGLRAEVGARMLMSFGASQINMSPMRGFSFILRSIDQMSRGPRTGVKKTGGFKIAQSPVIRLLNDFEKNISARGFGPKLHDFVDSLLGNRERSFMRFNPEERTWVRPDGVVDVRQPGAMDVWTGREMGFVDSGLISHLARKISREEGLAFDNRDIANSPATIEAQKRLGYMYRKSVTKIDEDGAEHVTDEPMAAYRARLEAFNKEHGTELEEAWTGSPTAEQYEWMLTRYNQIAHELNEKGWLQRSYDNDPWTVADIQAIGWVRIQKALDIDPGGPTNMFSQNAAQVAFEVIPGDHAPLRRAIPMHRASNDAKDRITSDVSQVLADVISRETGATIMRVVPGMGGWVTDAGEHTLSPNTYWEILGSDGQIRDSIDMLSYLLQQDGIMAMKRPQKGGGGEMPTKSSKTRHWGYDFVPRVAGRQPPSMTLMLDALREYLDSNGMPWKGSMNGARETGEMAVRTLNMDLPAGTDEVGFRASMVIPPEVEASLLDGSWATKAGFGDGKPIPVDIISDMHETISRWHDWGADEARAKARIAKGEKPEVAYREEMGRKILEDLRYEGVEGIPDRIHPNDVELGTTPVPEGMVRVYHYTRAPDEVLEQGLLRSKAIGETYGEPNVIWTSTQMPKPGSHAGIVEIHVRPEELDMIGPPRTQAEIDDLHARGSNIPLNVEAIPPDRFVAFSTPKMEGYRYLIKTYGRTPTPEDVATVRSLFDIPGIDLKDPQVAGYKRWVDEYDAGTLETGGPEIIKGRKTRQGRNRGSIADSLVDRHMGTLSKVWDRSFQTHDADAWAAGRGERHLLDFYDGDDAYTQNSPRGWRGATAWDNTRRATLYTNDRADLTTLVHESFHFWAEELDPSGVEAIHNAWAKAKKIKKADRPTKHDRLVREAEEWAGEQFELYAAGGFEAIDLPVEVNALFNAYGEWGRRTGALPGVDMDPRLKKIFDGMTPAYHRGPMATFDINQFRFMEAARIALQRAYEEAFQVHYFKRGRTWLERSVNHPYLGMYPASYMWGKVLPELIRFLVRKPFGIDAPFAGLAMANHVYQAVQVELSSDSDLAQLLEDNPEALRFISLLIPGTPWDIPVNIPAWMRRLVKADQRGEPMDATGAFTDSLSYAFGAGRGPFDLLQFGGQTAQFAAGLAGLAAGQPYASKAEREAIAETPAPPPALFSNTPPTEEVPVTPPPTGLEGP